MKTKRIKIYFSFRSPYSWLAMYQLDRIGLGPDAGIEYIPFFEPDTHWSERLRKRGGEFIYAPMHKDKHYYILQDIRRLAAKYRMSLTWPIDKKPDWSVPHLTYLACCRINLQVPFFWRVYQERWEKGTDIWLWSTMHSILCDISDAPNSIIDAAQGEAVGVLAEEALFAIYRDGIFGVPYFLHGQNRFWGLDRLPDFLESLGDRIEMLRTGVNADKHDFESRQPPPPAPQDTILSPYDTDHAGGCG